MKKTLILFAASAALMLSASCQKTPVAYQENGYLTFGEFALEVDETVMTKAEEADDNYTISIYDADEKLVMTKTYAQVQENEDRISIPAGKYT